MSRFQIGPLPSNIPDDGNHEPTSPLAFCLLLAGHATKSYAGNETHFPPGRSPVENWARVRTCEQKTGWKFKEFIGGHDFGDAVFVLPSGEEKTLDPEGMEDAGRLSESQGRAASLAEWKERNRAAKESFLNRFRQNSGSSCTTPLGNLAPGPVKKVPE